MWEGWRGVLSSQRRMSRGALLVERLTATGLATLGARGLPAQRHGVLGLARSSPPIPTRAVPSRVGSYLERDPSGLGLLVSYAQRTFLIAVSYTGSGKYMREPGS